MNITGSQRQILKDWIMDAYKPEQLRILVLEKMNSNLHEYVNTQDAYSIQVPDLIEYFRAKGLLSKFIKVAREDTPDNPFLNEKDNLQKITEIEGGNTRGNNSENGNSKTNQEIDETESSRVGLSSEESFYKIIASGFRYGRVIPFLCAGVDLCDPQSINPITIAAKLAQYLRGNADFNPEDFLRLSCSVSVCKEKVKQWSQQEGNIPEECAFLGQIKASTVERPSDSQQSELSNEQRLALAKINLRLLSQYFQSDNDAIFYDTIRDICREEPEISNNNKRNPIHTFLAKLPQKMREKNFKLPYKLIVTTSYDDSLERAFYYEKQPFDLIYYVADGQYRGKFKHMICNQFGHRTYDDFWEQEKPNIKPLDSKSEDILKGRPTILKLYGTLMDKFVITEDDYLSYLSSSSVSDVLPTNLLELLAVVKDEKEETNQILLLGYSPSYFDLELILNRFVADQKPIVGDFFMVHQSKPGSLEERIWKQKSPKRLNSGLEDFISNLEKNIDNLKPNRNNNY